MTRRAHWHMPDRMAWNRYINLADFEKPKTRKDKHKQIWAILSVMMKWPMFATPGYLYRIVTEEQRNLTRKANNSVQIFLTLTSMCRSAGDTLEFFTRSQVIQIFRINCWWSTGDIWQKPGQTTPIFCSECRQPGILCITMENCTGRKYIWWKQTTYGRPWVGRKAWFALAAIISGLCICTKPSMISRALVPAAQKIRGNILGTAHPGYALYVITGG